MITNYKKYTRKPLNEKLEINISDLVDDINSKVTNSFDKVKNKVFKENTSDGFPLNVGEEYYALAKYEHIKDKDNKAKEALDGNIFWVKLRLTEEDNSFYKYIIISTDIGIPKESGNILDDKENIKIIKNKEEKIPVGRINGYYLYKEKQDVKEVLDKYGIKYDSDNIKQKEKEVKSEESKIKVGEVYTLINSKGDKVNLGIIKINDDEVFAENMDKITSYNNMKIDKFDSAKHVDSIYGYLKDKVEELKLRTWKDTDEFQSIKDKKSEVIKFVTKRVKRLISYGNVLNNLIENEEYSSKAELGGLTSLVNSINGILNNIYNYINRTYKVNLKEKLKKSKKKKEEKPEVETVEDKTETKEEKEKKEEVEKVEKKAKEVQPNIQKDKKEKPKKEKEKEEPKKEESTVEEPKKISQEELVTSENIDNKRFKKFNDIVKK